MINIETSLYDEIARALLKKFRNLYVSSEHVLSPPKFPAVFIEQTLSVEHEFSRDSSQEENVNSITWSVNVFSNSESNAKQECYEIIEVIDTIMRKYNMLRITAMPVDNALDPSIYRFLTRYIGNVAKDGYMYWR